MNYDMQKQPSPLRALWALLIIPATAAFDVLLIILGGVIDIKMYSPPEGTIGTPFPAFTMVFTFIAIIFSILALIFMIILMIVLAVTAKKK